jgi:hypothetical protein
MHLTVQTLKMEASGSAETSFIIYQTIQRYIQEAWPLRQHRCENLKSPTIRAYLHSHSGPTLGVGDLGGHPWGEAEGAAKLALVYREK